MPGINPATYPQDLAAAALDLATNTTAAPSVNAEPPLACYVTVSCPAGGIESAAAPGSTRKKCRKGKHLKHGTCLSKRKKKK